MEMEFTGGVDGCRVMKVVSGEMRLMKGRVETCILATGWY